jgi:hypothetical protein
MSIDETVQDIKAKATRMHALAVMVETFKTPEAKKAFVMGMYECSAISSQCAEMLIENYGLEAA